jgi:hypothetical protein
VEPDALGRETTTGERSTIVGLVVAAGPGMGTGEGLGGGGVSGGEGAEVAIFIC